MASTVLSDINFLSEPFRDVLSGTFTHRLELFNSILSNASGYVTPDTGYTQAIPVWNTLSGSSVQITTSLTTTINNLTDYKDVGVWIEREKAWGADQMLRVVAGRDATTEIARQLGEYWASEIHRVFVSGVFTGVFATALATTHTYDDSGNTINIPGLIQAKNKLGDNGDLLNSISMHSKVFGDALNDKVVTYDKSTVDSYGTGEVAMILGMKPYVTDKLAATTAVYPVLLGMKGSAIYLFRPRPKAQFSDANVFQINTGTVSIDIELNRIATTGGGQDQLISRASFLVHIPGVKFDTTSVTSNPTDTQLATGSNWSKVVSDDKLIKLVQYKCA